MNIDIKQTSFNNAMQRYHDSNYYQYIYKVVSVLNVSMQVYLSVVLFTLATPWYSFVAIMIVAYLVTDFINGYVHMYMDNNHNYDSLVGPFIASFHLHHQNPNYRDFPIWKIYFNESGSKFWLVPFLMLTIVVSLFSANEYFLLFLIFIGIFSSVAEVSHFLCHNSNSKIVLFLQKTHILLSMKHHIHHHEKDNQSYAFLNGSSDVILDKIATKFYSGYKEHSDLHAKMYVGPNTDNRG